MLAFHLTVVNQPIIPLLGACAPGEAGLRPPGATLSVETPGSPCRVISVSGTIPSLVCFRYDTESGRRHDSPARGLWGSWSRQRLPPPATRRSLLTVTDRSVGGRQGAPPHGPQHPTTCTRSTASPRCGQGGTPVEIYTGEACTTGVPRVWSALSPRIRRSDFLHVNGPQHPLLTPARRPVGADKAAPQWNLHRGA